MSQNMTPAELAKENRKLMLAVFGRSLLGMLFGVMCYLALGMLGSLGEELVGYKYYTEPVEAGLVETLFETTFQRYDEYLTDGDSVKLEKSYVYNYDTHAFEYSAELTDKTRQTRPIIDVEALKEQVPEGVQVQAIYVRDPLLKGIIETVSQIVLLVLLVAVIYERLWRQGDHDRNKVQFGRMPEDKHRGLRAGLLGSVPAAVVVLGLFVSKITGLMPNYIFFYRLLTMPFAPLNNLLTGGMQWTAQISWWMLPLSVLCWTVVPLTAAIAYRLGYKGISVGDRIVYKKK